MILAVGRDGPSMIEARLHHIQFVAAHRAVRGPNLARFRMLVDALGLRFPSVDALVASGVVVEWVVFRDGAVVV